MWMGPIHDKDFTSRILESIKEQQDQYHTWPRIHGMVSIANEVSGP